MQTASIAATSLVVACHSSDVERVEVPTSDPRIACARVEGPGSSRTPESAIAHAKGARASTYEKNRNGNFYSPANVGKFEPYSATLKDGVWHIQGTVPPDLSWTSSGR